MRFEKSQKRVEVLHFGDTQISIRGISNVVLYKKTAASWKQISARLLKRVRSSLTPDDFFEYMVRNRWFQHNLATDHVVVIDRSLISDTDAGSSWEYFLFSCDVVHTLGNRFCFIIHNDQEHTYTPCRSYNKYPDLWRAICGE